MIIPTTPLIVVEVKIEDRIIEATKVKVLI